MDDIYESFKRNWIFFAAGAAPGVCFAMYVLVARLYGK